MKNFKYSIAFLAIVALLFTSCSKDEASDTASPDIQETFQLHFGTLLNDFSTKQNKDHLIEDPVECRVADPSYVLVALTDSNNDWVAGKNPTAGNANLNDFIKIPIKNNNGSWETDFSPELGLPAGTYFLEYFIVYSADDEVLWVAPREGGAYASSVADPLPQTIVLGAGTKPYVDVDVLCYVPRVEEAFGYIFFDINLIEVENNYCIFVNYCGTTGRDYPAKFEVDVWSDSFDGSDVVIDGAMNSVSGAGNNFAATVLCFPLPPLDGNDVYYVRVTVLDTDAYDLGAENEFEFTISQDDIDDQLDETPRYEHIRINCEDDGGNGNGGDPCDTDSTGDSCDPDDDGLTNEEERDLGTDPNDDDTDGDGVLDGDDDCPLTDVLDGQVDPDGDGCWTDPVVGCTPTSCSMSTSPSDLCYFSVVDLGNPDDFYKVSSGPSPASFDLEGDRGLEIVKLGSFSAEIVNGQVKIIIDGALDTDRIKAYEIQVRPNDGGEFMSSSCFHTLCASDITPLEGNPEITLTFEDFQYEYPIFVRVKAIICEEEVAGP